MCGNARIASVQQDGADELGRDAVTATNTTGKFRTHQSPYKYPGLETPCVAMSTPRWTAMGALPCVHSLHQKSGQEGPLGFLDR
jgi:hypothetical protein